MALQVAPILYFVDFDILGRSVRQYGYVHVVKKESNLMILQLLWLVFEKD